MPDCPNCGLSAYVNATELGYLCVFCLHHWPYDDTDLAEPDYDFAAFREWCETFDIKVQWIHFEFVKWLYSDANAMNNA